MFASSPPKELPITKNKQFIERRLSWTAGCCTHSSSLQLLRGAYKVYVSVAFLKAFLMHDFVGIRGMWAHNSWLEERFF